MLQLVVLPVEYVSLLPNSLILYLTVVCASLNLWLWNISFLTVLCIDKSMALSVELKQQMDLFVPFFSQSCCSCSFVLDLIVSKLYTSQFFFFFLNYIAA